MMRAVGQDQIVLHSVDRCAMRMLIASCNGAVKMRAAQSESHEDAIQKSMLYLEWRDEKQF